VILLKMIGMVDPYFIMPVYSISACSFSAMCGSRHYPDLVSELTPDTSPSSVRP